MPSCEGLATDCGPSSNENCCATRAVQGGEFFRSYDGVDSKDRNAPATVSDFRLDRFEVTVGRFRKFLAAWQGGWRPATDAGKHAHVNAGHGLNVTTGGYEPGWTASWADSFPANKTAWDSALSCGSPLYTWTSAPGAHEDLPLNCTTFVEAYAFCAWDGGFLPTEAEWNYAAAGGAEQRVYPWSSPADAKLIDCTYANSYNSYTGFYCGGQNGFPNRVGSESPRGDGKFGQADLSGNLQEYTLDYRSASYTTPCNDCLNLTVNGQRAARGGWYGVVEVYLSASYRSGADATTTNVNTGIRCARAPE